MINENVILEIKDLSISFEMYGRGLEKNKNNVTKDINLNVIQGEIMAIVGGSGSGKSLLAHSIMGVLPNNSNVEGSIYYKGKKLDIKLIKELRGKEISLVPQSVDFLDPLMKIEKQIVGLNGKRERFLQILKKYDLDESVMNLYPFQLSGGMARRILVAASIINEPKLLIADEPTPGLSLNLAMETLYIFRELANKGTSILFITHDIDLALEIADRIAVFYEGTIVEVISKRDFMKGTGYLEHSYSKKIYEALPINWNKSN